MWHRRSWPSAAPSGTAVWSPRCRPRVVPLLPLQQPAGLSFCYTGTSHPPLFTLCALFLGPHLYIFCTADVADEVKQHQVNMHMNAMMMLSCICTVVSMIKLLPSHGWSLPWWCQPLDGRQPPQVECREDRSTLGWVEVQCWGSAWQQWSVGAVWHRGYLCASDLVRVLGVTISSDLSMQCTSTCLMSAHPAFVAHTT